jgi:hypothetical protein
MENVFGSQVKLSPHHQLQKIQIQLLYQLLSPQYQHAHQVSIKMDTETASLQMFLLFVHQDMKVMEMEIVSQLLQIYHHFQQFVQVDKLVMEMETVSQ